MGLASMAFAGELTIDKADTAWIMMSAALVLLMTPGLAMFYGGMVRSKNVLGTIMHSFVAIAVITRNIKRLSGVILTATYIGYMTYVFVFTRGV